MGALKEDTGSWGVDWRGKNEEGRGEGNLRGGFADRGPNEHQALEKAKRKSGKMRVEMKKNQREGSRSGGGDESEAG